MPLTFRRKKILDLFLRSKSFLTRVLPRLQTTNEKKSCEKTKDYINFLLRVQKSKLWILHIALLCPHDGAMSTFRWIYQVQTIGYAECLEAGSMLKGNLGGEA